MANYQLLYWSVPFRGQFVRAVLAYAGQDWDETDDGEIAQIMEGDVLVMPVPFMGPPVLIDRTAAATIAQMPAIILYLGETLDLLPETPMLKALTIKVVNDANDVIDEITLDGGREMWTTERWQEFRPRLQKWMRIWEETGRRHGLTESTGYLLGGDEPGIADIVTATLWTIMRNRFGKIDEVLIETAPMTAALCERIYALPALAGLAATAHREYGDDYAGGEIGASMAKVLK